MIHLSNRQKISILLTTIVSAFLFLVFGVIILLNHFQWYNHEREELLNEFSEVKTENLYKENKENEQEDETEDDYEHYVYQDIYGKGVARGVFNSALFTEEVFKKQTEDIFRLDYSGKLFPENRNFLVILQVLPQSKIAYAMDVTTYIKIENNLIFSALIVLLIAVLLSFLVGYYTAGFILEPLNQLIRKTQSASLEKIPDDILIIGKDSDEMVRLSQTMHEMFKKITKSAEKIKQFNHDVSHELKTPLAIIKSDLELVKITKDISQINITIDELDHLARMIDKLLFLAQQNNKINFSNINDRQIKNLIEKIQEKYHKIYQAKKINFELKIVGNFKINVNQELFRELVQNLLENGYKYTASSGCIKIEVSKDNIIFSNTSAKIEKESLEKIFDLFYKIENVRSNATGYGIGLSVVRKITDVFNWKIKAEYQNGLFQVICRF